MTLVHETLNLHYSRHMIVNICTWSDKIMQLITKHLAVPDCYLSASCVQFVFLKKPFSKKSGWLLTGRVPGQLRFGRAPSEITAVISRNNKPINLPGRGCETGHLFMHVALTEKWKLKSLSTHLRADWRVEWSCSFLLNSWSRRETFSNV